MENKKSKEEVSETFKHIMYMFVILSNEASKYGWSLHQGVKFQFKAILNNYLTAANRLEKHVYEFIDQEKAEDVAELMSTILECLSSDNREEFLAYVSAYFQGKVEVTSDDQEQAPQA